MEEKEIEVNGENVKIVTKLSKEYVDDNNLKILLDDTIDLEDVICEINK